MSFGAQRIYRLAVADDAHIVESERGVGPARTILKTGRLLQPLAVGDAVGGVREIILPARHDADLNVAQQIIDAALHLAEAVFVALRNVERGSPSRELPRP